MLQQFGLKESDLAGAVTYAGTDVKAGLGQGFIWVSCVPEIPKRMVVDGTGTALVQTHLTNSLTRQLVDDSRRVMDKFNVSDAAKVVLVSVGGMGEMHC